MPRSRLHKSSIVVGLIVAVLLVLIEIPGRVVSGIGGTAVSKVIEHGWPWVYLRRETAERYVPESVTTPEGLSIVPSFSPVIYPLDTRTDLPRWGIPWLSAENWRFWESDSEDDPSRSAIHAVNLVFNLAVVLVLLGGVVTVWEIRRRRRTRLLAFRFGLRGMLLSIAAAGALFGWLTNLEREHKRETALMDRVDERTGPMEATWYVIDQVCVAPLWLRSLVGVRLFPEYFWRASTVNIESERGDTTDLICAEIAQFDHLTEISLDGHPRHRFRFSALRNLERIKTLEIWRPTILDEQALSELAQLKQLQKIVIEDIDEIGPEALARLEAALPNCKIIDDLDDW